MVRVPLVNKFDKTINPGIQDAMQEIISDDKKIQKFILSETLEDMYEFCTTLSSGYDFYEFLYFLECALKSMVSFDMSSDDIKLDQIISLYDFDDDNLVSGGANRFQKLLASGLAVTSLISGTGLEKSFAALTDPQSRVSNIADIGTSLKPNIMDVHPKAMNIDTDINNDISDDDLAIKNELENSEDLCELFKDKNVDTIVDKIEDMPLSKKQKVIELFKKALKYFKKNKMLILKKVIIGTVALTAAIIVGIVGLVCIREYRSRSAAEKHKDDELDKVLRNKELTPNTRRKIVEKKIKECQEMLGGEIELSREQKQHLSVMRKNLSKASFVGITRGGERIGLPLNVIQENIEDLENRKINLNTAVIDQRGEDHDREIAAIESNIKSYQRLKATATERVDNFIKIQENELKAANRRELENKIKDMIYYASCDNSLSKLTEDVPVTNTAANAREGGGGGQNQPNVKPLEQFIRDKRGETFNDISGTEGMDRLIGEYVPDEKKEGGFLGFLKSLGPGVKCLVGAGAAVWAAGAFLWNTGSSAFNWIVSTLGKLKKFGGYLESIQLFMDRVKERITELLEESAKQMENLSNEERIRNLLQELKENVFGQDRAISEVISYVRGFLNDIECAEHMGGRVPPLILFLAGISGCGKSLIASIVAKHLAFNPECIIKIYPNKFENAKTTDDIARAFVGRDNPYFNFTDAQASYAPLRRKYPNAIIVFLVEEVDKMKNLGLLLEFARIIYDQGYYDLDGKRYSFDKTFIQFPNNMSAKSFDAMFAKRGEKIDSISQSEDQSRSTRDRDLETSSLHRTKAVILDILKLYALEKIAQKAIANYAEFYESDIGGKFKFKFSSDIYKNIAHYYEKDNLQGRMAREVAAMFSSKVAEIRRNIQNSNQSTKGVVLYCDAEEKDNQLLFHIGRDKQIINRNEKPTKKLDDYKTNKNNTKDQQVSDEKTKSPKDKADQRLPYPSIHEKLPNHEKNKMDASIGS